MDREPGIIRERPVIVPPMLRTLRCTISKSGHRILAHFWLATSSWNARGLHLAADTCTNAFCLANDGTNAPGHPVADTRAVDATHVAADALTNFDSHTRTDALTADAGADARPWAIAVAVRCVCT